MEELDAKTIEIKLQQLLEEGLKLYESLKNQSISPDRYQELSQIIIDERNKLNFSLEFVNAREIDYNRADAIMRGAR